MDPFSFSLPLLIPLSLEVGPLNSARSLGSTVCSQAGSGQDPSWNYIWCILVIKYAIWWQQCNLKFGKPCVTSEVSCFKNNVICGQRYNWRNNIRLWTTHSNDEKLSKFHALIFECSSTDFWSPSTSVPVGTEYISHWLLVSCFASIGYIMTTQLNSTQQDITDVGADTSYVRIYISNLIKTLWL